MHTGTITISIATGHAARATPVEVLLRAALARHLVHSLAGPAIG
jgi:hypothetical protein